MRATLCVILTVALAACSAPRRPERETGFERISADTIAQGERLARVLGCTGCHGDDLAGRDWSDDLGTLWTANLTRSIRTLGPEGFSQAVITGRRPGSRDLWDMPSHLFTQLNADELAAVAAYVGSRPMTGVVHPDPANGPFLQAKLAKGIYKSSAAYVAQDGRKTAPEAAGHDLARHITRATCAECHGIDLRGKTNPIDGKATPDIRPLAASYSEADFERFLTTGKAAGGRELPLMSDVARSRYSHLTKAERAAIHAYLKVLAQQP